MIRALICLFALFFPVFPGAAGAADRAHTLTHQGMERVYTVHTPPQYKENGARLPVVLALHGGGGTGAGFMAASGLTEAADRAGMIIVYPEGIAARGDKFRTWNAGICCGLAKEKDIDDVGFLSAVIDAVVRDYRADAVRVFATGHSNGAMMSYRLGCELSGRIAAIAPVGGQASFTACPGYRPVRVLHIHGTADDCAAYGGGPACGGCFQAVLRGLGISPKNDGTWACEAVPSVVAKQAAVNGCRMKAEIVHADGALSCRAWRNCPAGGETVLCDIAGAGHAWPGGVDPAFCQRRPEGKLCRSWQSEVGPAADVSVGDLIFGFFAGRF